MTEEEAVSISVCLLILFMYKNVKFSMSNINNCVLKIKIVGINAAT